jgi:hypothetical protein
MNTILIPLVRRTMVVAAMAAVLPCFSQGGKDGLTKDFSKLSAKERTKVAERENREAATDTNYQAVMHAAESAFRSGDYEKALVGYKEARKMRPYNVYPKVKIQDLQALLKKQATTPLAVADTTPVDMGRTDPVVTATPSSEDPSSVSVPPSARTATAAPSFSTRPARAPEPVPERKPEPPQPPLSVPARTQQPQAPEGASMPKTLGERVFLEAGAVVTERTVMDDGRPTVYRRVVHPSGQVFTFKDGLSIPERMWRKRFGG